MNYRIDFLGVPDKQNVPEQVITVPCGVVPNILYYTNGDSATRCLWKRVNNFTEKQILDYGQVWPHAQHADSPYLPEYASTYTNGYANKFNYTSFTESDCCLICEVKFIDGVEYLYSYYMNIRIQYRNINQYEVYDGYQYQ